MAESSFWSGSVRGGGPSAVQAASLAALHAAENLVRKTVDALARGDDEKARRLATLAAERPFDEHEEIWPGPWAAHYALFELVTDRVEEWPEDDHTWVQVLADLCAETSGRQLEELRHLGAVLCQDARLLGVDKREVRLLRTLADGVDPLAQPVDLVPPGERADYVLGLARLVALLRHRLDPAHLMALRRDRGPGRVP